MSRKRRWLLLGYASGLKSDKPTTRIICASDAELNRELGRLERTDGIKRITAELAP